MKALQSLSQRVRECRERGGAVVLVGIGNELRGDDAAGLLAAEEVIARKLPHVHGILGGAAPENVTGAICSCAPELTIFVDAADMGFAPGETALIEPGEIGGISFSTHTLPLQVIINYLARALSSEFLVVGIQPKSVDFAAPVAAEVRAAAAAVADAVCGIEPA